MWRRDWSALAMLRTSRLRNRGTAPAPASIGRTVGRPTLRLFGAGRNPGPSTATALPRSLPLVLRLRPPARPVGPPLLTLQSELPAEAMPDAAPPVASPATETSPAATQTAPQAEPAVVASGERRESPAPAPSLVSRALRLFRRPARPAPVEPAPVAAEAEPAPPSAPAPVRMEAPEAPPVARQPQQPAQQPPLVLRRASEAPAEAPASAPQAEPTPQREEARETEVTLNRQAAPPQPDVTTSRPPAAPEPIEATPVVTAARETPLPSQTLPQAIEPPPRRSEPAGGLLFTLRRIFRPEPAVEPDEPLGAPSPEAQAPSPSASATPSVARLPEQTAPVLSARQETASKEGSGEEQGPTADRAVEAPEPEEAPRRRPEAPPQPGQGGLLFTLRRLFRAEPEREAASPFGTTQEAPAAPSQAVAPEPLRAPQVARQASETTLPGEVPMAPAPRASAPPALRSAAEESLTLARPRILAADAEPGETEAPAIDRSEAVEEPAGREAAPALTGGEAPPTPPERRREEPGPDEAPPLRRIARRADGDQGVAAIRRMPRPVPAAAAPAPSLVYLARKQAAVAERTPEGMSTYQVPREQLARLGYRTNGDRDLVAQAATIARAVTLDEVETAVGGDTTGAAADAAAPGGEAGAQISMENLARRVYDRIRARLRIERERSGLSSGVVSR
jgi:hypothetical protein